MSLVNARPSRQPSANTLQAVLKAGCCPCCGQMAHFDNVLVSLEFNSISFRGQTVFVTPIVAEIIFVFAERMPRVATRELLIDQVWGTALDVVPKSLDVLLVKVRRVLAKLGLALETIRGVGWRMIEEGENGSDRRS